VTYDPLPARTALSASARKGLLSCPQLQVASPIPLPPSPEPPEALGELANTGIGIPRELFKGRVSPWG